MIFNPMGPRDPLAGPRDPLEISTESARLKKKSKIAETIEKFSQTQTTPVQRKNIPTASQPKNDIISDRKGFFEKLHREQASLLQMKRSREETEQSETNERNNRLENTTPLKRRVLTLSPPLPDIQITKQKQRDDPSESQPLKKSRQDDPIRGEEEILIRQEKDIEQLFSETFHQDIKEVKEPYHKIIANLQESLNITVTPTQVYRFLLKPEQQQIRDDFLLAGPWMVFFREDIQKAKELAEANKKYKEEFKAGNLSDQTIEELKTAKAQGPILLKQMENLFTAENCTDEQKKVILEFASKLIRRGIFAKDVFDQGPLSVENVTKMIETVGNFDLALTIRAFIDTKAKAQQKAIDIPYTFYLKPAPSQRSRWAPAAFIKQKHNAETPETCYPSLAESFIRIAKKQMTDKEEEEFIKQFSKDLAVLSYHNIKSVHPSEFYRQAWSKTPAQSPNVSHMAHTFNQLSGFVVDQIVNANNLRESKRIYTIFVKIAATLETLHDYQDSMSITCSLSNAAVDRLAKGFNLSKNIQDLLKHQTQLFSPGKNFKTLNSQLETLQHPKLKDQQPIGHVPYLAIFLSQLTFADDGNPDSKEKINFSRIKMFAQIHRQIETAQNGIEDLSTQQMLHYNVIEEIVKGTVQSESAQYKKSLNLLPRGK